MRMNTQEATLACCLLTAGRSAYIAVFFPALRPARGDPVGLRAPTFAERTPEKLSALRWE